MHGARKLRCALLSFELGRPLAPIPQVARILGSLKQIELRSKCFVLRLDSGATLEGTAPALRAEQLTSAARPEGRRGGTVTFDASGQPLRVEADYLAAARAGDEIWAPAPRAAVASVHAPVPAADVAPLYGRWPGDETDEQIFEALDELS